MNKDQATQRQWIKIGFEKGAKGGNIYPQNCHFISPHRISYNFPNAITSDDFKDCQVAIELIEERVNCHDELVEALKEICTIGQELKQYNAKLSKEERRCFAIAKQALAKAEAQ